MPARAKPEVADIKTRQWLNKDINKQTLLIHWRSYLFPESVNLHRHNYLQDNRISSAGILLLFHFERVDFWFESNSTFFLPSVLFFFSEWHFVDNFFGAASFDRKTIHRLGLLYLCGMRVKNGFFDLIKANLYKHILQSPESRVQFTDDTGRLTHDSTLATQFSIYFWRTCLRMH